MPATEQTWRNQKRMHVIFAVSAAVMGIATVWMMAADHFREWKKVQLTDRRKDAWMLEARHDALAAQYAPREREVQQIIRRVDGEPIDAKLVEEFKQAVAAESARLRDDRGGPTANEDGDPASSLSEPSEVAIVNEAPVANDEQFDKLDQRIEELDRAAARVRELEAQAKQDADQAESVEEARSEAAEARRRALGELDVFVREARRRENRLVGEKKTLNGERTAAVSELGIMIGENAPQGELDDAQQRIEELDRQIADRTTRIAAAKDYRTALENIIAEVDAEKAQAVKDFDAMKTELTRLEEQVSKNTTNIGEWVTRLPVVNALYSGNVRIDQNWLPDLTINYNFAQVARFDRCTTCHRAISTTAAGAATEPQYPTIPEGQRRFTVELRTPAEQPPEGATLRSVYGMQLSDRGIITDADVTVHYVMPESPAARAGVDTGDVIEAINDSEVDSPDAVRDWLLRMAPWDSTVTMTLRRGLDHPYTAHPRLDLYLSDISPHPQKVVGCTICHDGQGSGTSFQWTSHTPNDATEQDDWARAYGWSDNHHWIFPMKPKRFVESNCLKCHHQKGGLEPSERFPEPPAPKLVEGWTLVEEYGCFGCHEINGYDSPTVTVGPDVRLEPPYHEVAAQLLRDRNLSDDERRLARQLIERPEDAETRNLLSSAIKQHEQSAGEAGDDEPTLSADTRKLVAALKDIEIPGEYRKVGPSLRFLSSKVEYDWLYSWIRKPSDFRPDTRMPQFFGLWEHLTEQEDIEELAETLRLEPIEIRALAEYLLNQSGDFEYAEAAEGVSEQASAERGRWLFESRGCLACHSHSAFPDIHSTQGPNLSRLSSKLDTPKGRRWLYSWLKEPQHYHPRTKMPDLYLDPVETKDAQGQPTGAVTDPAADIAAFLLDGEGDWRPENVPQRGELSERETRALAELAELWLASDAIPRTRARQYILGAGIPSSQQAKLKPDERVLVGLTDQNRTDRLLEFVGRRTVSKYGCYGCHDIPGFEDAKPVGTALVDWGRKEPSKLAFENIHRFLETHGIEPSNPDQETLDRAEAIDAEDQPPVGTVAQSAGHSAAAGHTAHLDPGEFDGDTSYFIQAINSHSRDGFLWQKLRFPRSYDYKTTRNKNFNERLRMPRFPFTDVQREAVMTFVLGLTKEPPASKYLYEPDARGQAIVDGRQVLEKFNCAGCHTLKMEQWRLAYDSETFDDPAEIVDFPFLAPHFSDQQIAASQAKDYRGLLHTDLHGEPVIDADTGDKFMVDEDRAPITREELAEAEAEEGEKIPVFYPFTLWRNALLDGKSYLRGVDELLVPANADKYGPELGDAYPAWGGDLARYLFPKVVERARQANPQVNAKEAWGWLPPPLTDEGRKVQTDWLHNFLMDPYAIRPATVLRMPNFHMSSEDAAKLVDYFAAASDAQFPYEYRPQQQSSYLASLRRRRQDPLGEAMNIVTNGNYCVKCHAVADFAPQGDPATFGPDLAQVYRRLRPTFTRDWIANPVRTLHYTGMPVNIPYRPDEEHLGGVSQELYRGTSIEQVQGVVDLLMNFDAYARDQTSITPLVEAAAEAARRQGAAAGGEQPPASGGQQPQGAPQ